MNDIKSYKALAIVSNVDQGELVKRLIKDNKRLIKENKEREESYSTKKDNLLRLREYHIEMKYIYDEEDEDVSMFTRVMFHLECLQTITSILMEEYGIDV